jgi:hypothetical protein
MRWLPFLHPVIPALILAACAATPELAYESAPDGTDQNGVDSGEARALEQAEADCAREGKHAVSKRVEGETVYDCAD